MFSQEKSMVKRTQITCWIHSIVLTESPCKVSLIVETATECQFLDTDMTIGH